MVKLFLAIYDWFEKHRKAMWGILLLSVLLCVAGALRVDFKEDVADFLPADKENRDISWAFSHIGDANKVVLTLSPSGDADRDLLMDAVDTLEAAILSCVPEEYIASVTARIEGDDIDGVTGFIADNLPYYLTDDDYGILDSLLASGSLTERLGATRAVVTSPVGGPLRSVVTKDPLLLSGPRLRRLESFNANDSFHTEDDYVFTSDGSALVTLDLAFGASDTYKAGRFIKALDEAVSRTEASMGGAVTADPLGSVYIAYTNSSQIKKDSLLSIVIAIALIALLLVSFFRKGKGILMVGVTILYGFLLALSATSLAMGSISLIVIGMGAVIIGIAANYPLHFISHIRQGYSPRESLNDIVLPLTTGNITTVGAFLSLLFIASPAMHDLGLFSALLLVGTILFTLIFLPHFYPEETEPQPEQARFWDTVGRLNLGGNKYVLLAVAVITIVLSFFDDRVKFDSDLHNINYMTPHQRENMDRMLSLAQGDRNVTYIAALGSDLEEALQAYEALRPQIESLPEKLYGEVTVNSLQDYVPSRAVQEERLRKWDAFVSEHGAELEAMLAEAAAETGFTPGAFDPFIGNLHREYAMQEAGYFAPLTDKVAAGHFIVDDGRCAVLTSIGSDGNLTEEISEAISDPRAVVFDSGSMTGKMVGSLSLEFDTVLYFCAFIVFLLLTISFGRIELAGIAFLPLVLGWIWILGVMGIAGIDFNIVNIILATFIFGMGDDYTIFITEGVMYEHAYGRKMLKTYEKTIILSALIMFVGIGSLILARHPAMKSLAQVIMIGMFSVVIMAVVVPPFLYRFLTRKKGKVRKEPLTLVNFGATVLAFLVFLVGAALITIAGFFLITLTFGSKKGKALYHGFLSGVCRFVFNNVFLTTHSVECDETFDKPAVIVANHQSHLDLMATLMLTPKLVVVTNKWVWNNPLYAILIRYADFCPIENVLTDDLSKIERSIADGYSVLVFPEGTRTMDGRIGRFHKGAFYLAEKYRLDIIPVVLHGFHDVLPKEDLLLRKGRLTVKVLPRIRPEDTSFGVTDRERSKAVRHLMIAELERIASRTETADYYANHVTHNYIYKGADIGRTVRRSMRVHGNYRELSESLPEGGRVLFVNPSLGEPALVCALVRKGLQVDAVMEDPMLHDLASHCVGNPDNLRYLRKDEPAERYDLKVIFDGKGDYTIVHE